MKAEKKIVGRVQPIDVFNKRLDNLIAMRSIDGSGYHAVSDGENGFQMSLISNGALVVVSVHISTEEKRHYRYELPERFRPLTEMILYRDELMSSMLVGQYDGQPPFVEGNIEPKYDDEGNLIPVVFECTYPTKYFYVAEIEDARVGFDGTTYPTIGDAIRSQFEQVVDTGNDDTEA